MFCFFLHLSFFIDECEILKFCYLIFLDLYKARMNMPILNREYNEAMKNLSSAEAKALALPLCTEVTKLLLQ